MCSIAHALDRRLDLIHIARRFGGFRACQHQLFMTLERENSVAFLDSRFLERRMQPFDPPHLAVADAHLKISDDKALFPEWNGKKAGVMKG